MNRIGGGFPDPVQTFIRRFKRPRIFQIAENGNGKHIEQTEISADRINADKTEGCAAVLQHSVLRDIKNGVMNRMILIGRTHRFTRRLAEAETDARSAIQITEQTNSAVQLDPEIKKNPPAVHNFKMSVDTGCVNTRLNLHPSGQILRMGTALLPDNTLNRKIFPNSCVSDSIFVEHFFSFCNLT